MSNQSPDVLIIGAGPGGYVAAIRAAQLGLRATIVEREKLGGICLNWGCIPTKSLLRSAEVLTLARSAADYGVDVASATPSLEAMVKRSRKVADQLNRGVGHLLKKNGVEVLSGEARFDSPAEVVVSREGKPDQRLSPRAVVIATGARPRELPGLEADGERVWNYRHALNPDRIPERLLVIGSGAIGIEFAHFFRVLGSQVCVVEILDRILPMEDEEISAAAARFFTATGMEILTGTKVASLERRGEGVCAKLERGQGAEERLFDQVISAVGITGNCEGMGFEEAGVRVARGHVEVDAFGRTSAERVWAIGDVAGPPWLAHKASHEGVRVAEEIAGREPHAFHPTDVPSCTYCHPQIASVGLTEAAAAAQGLATRVGRFPLIGNGKAIALGDTDGFVKTIFDAESGALLGAHLIGPEVTEMIQGFAIARTLETTEEQLMQTIFPHPTVSEAMHESTLDAFDRVIHV